MRQNQHSAKQLPFCGEQESDHLGEAVTLPADSSKIEPGITPSEPVVLKWETFTEAADEAGMPRRYGGIHSKAADFVGRETGPDGRPQVWSKVQGYFGESDKTAVRDWISMTPTQRHFAQ